MLDPVTSIKHQASSIKISTMNAYRTIAFSLVMLLYLAYPHFLIYQQERVLHRGTAFRFALQPVDPIDAFRGRYLSLNYQSATLPAPEGLESGQTIYVTIREDSLGYAHFDQVFLEAPEDQPYIQTTGYPYNGEVSVDIPENLRRYFLNEKLAPAAEEAYFQLVQSSDQEEGIRAYAQVRVLNGDVLIEEVFLEGRPIREYLRGE